MKKEVEERKWHRMAKVDDSLEVWQGCENRCATEKKFSAQNKQMVTVRYIPDTEEIVEASWSLFKHDRAAAFTLSERSPFATRFVCKHLLGVRTQILHVR